jgi:hypothetical protein
MSESADFFKKMRDEILTTLERRTDIARDKIKFTYTFMGIGSAAGVYDGKYVYLLYLVPIIPILFDLLYFRESFSIHRIGAYLANRSPSDEEKEFEGFVENNRTSMEDLAEVCLNVCAVACSMFMIFALARDMKHCQWIDTCLWAIFLIYLSLLPYSFYMSKIYVLNNNSFLTKFCKTCSERDISVKRIKRWRLCAISWLWVAVDRYNIKKNKCETCPHIGTKHPA